MLRSILSYSVILLLFAFPVKGVSAQGDSIEKVWYIQEKTAKIEIYKAADGKYYGKVVWLKVPYVHGKPKIDIYNPDKAKRNRPLMGLVVLKGFVKISEGRYEYGTIYNPENGKTYSCKLTIDGSTLYVRGYLGISILGKSAMWTKAD